MRYGRSHKGREGVAAYIERVSLHGSIPVWFTGHSLGAALAIIAAGRWNMKHPIKGLYTFGSPGIGNRDFTRLFKNVNIVRVVHNKDIVTKASQSPGPLHIGHILFIDAQQKITKNPSSLEMTKKSSRRFQRFCFLTFRELFGIFPSRRRTKSHDCLQITHRNFTATISVELCEFRLGPDCDWPGLRKKFSENYHK